MQTFKARAHNRGTASALCERLSWSIRSIFVDGSPNGIVTAEIMNWNRPCACRTAFLPARYPEV